VFSLYNRNVGRLRAEEDMRLINLLASSQSSEGYGNTTKRLLEEYGEPVIRQRSGVIPMQKDAWDKLRALHG
jgi:hypothetical protein